VSDPFNLKGILMKQVVLGAIATHRKLVDEFERSGADEVVKAAEMIINCYNNGGCVYICGNGGSAADAQHIAGELIGRFKIDRKAMAAVALSTDTSILTCVGNDYGFDDIFARQVEGLVRQGDVLWAFSTSGTSVNVLNAVKTAKDVGAYILSFTGKKESPLGELSDVCLAVDAPGSAAAQEVHQIAYHAICELVEKACAR